MFGAQEGLDGLLLRGLLQRPRGRLDVGQCKFRPHRALVHASRSASAKRPVWEYGPWFSAARELDLFLGLIIGIGPVQVSSAGAPDRCQGPLKSGRARRTYRPFLGTVLPRPAGASGELRGAAVGIGGGVNSASTPNHGSEEKGACRMMSSLKSNQDRSHLHRPDGRDGAANS
jgi:hypothetical protein